MQKVIRSRKNCSNRLIKPIIRNLQCFGLYSQYSASIPVYHQDLWGIYVREKSFFAGFITHSPTLVYRIDVQYEINVQVGKFLKNIKRAGQNRRAGGICFWKINKRAGWNKCAGEITIFKILIKVHNFGYK